MDFEPDEYERITFTVKAKEVDFENVEQVAKWCKGTVEMQATRLLGTETPLPVIKIKGSGDDRGKEFTATLGCFIVERKGAYRVYKKAAFQSAFVQKTKTEPVKDEEEDEPFEPEKIELAS